MTIPYLMNCAHSDDAWCLDCVAQLGFENEKLRKEINSGHAIDLAIRQRDAMSLKIHEKDSQIVALKWLQKRGLKRTVDRTEAFHAGWSARDAEVEELRYLLQQHSELHSGWMDKQTLDRTEKALKHK